MAIICKQKDKLEEFGDTTIYTVVGLPDGDIVHIEKRNPGWTEDPKGFDTLVSNLTDINILVDGVTYPAVTLSEAIEREPVLRELSDHAWANETMDPERL
jgi:hypothetical protein